VIAGPESGVQTDTPERKQTALVAQYKALRSERAFLPATSMEVALARRSTIGELTRKIMVRDQDFGEIAGTGKPRWLKPGPMSGRRLLFVVSRHSAVWREQNVILPRARLSQNSRW